MQLFVIAIRCLITKPGVIDYMSAGKAKGAAELVFLAMTLIATWSSRRNEVGAPGDAEVATRSFLSTFDVVALDREIAERAVGLRRDHHIKLPDAIILATAQARAMLLVTRNSKDFAADDPGVRMPYRL